MWQEKQQYHNYNMWQPGQGARTDMETKSPRANAGITSQATQTTILLA